MEEEEGSSGLKLYLLLLHSFQAAWTGSPMLPQPCIDHCKLSSSQSCDNSVVTNHSGTFRKLSSNIIQQPLTFKSNKTFPFSGHQLTLCPHQFSMFYVDFRKCIFPPISLNLITYNMIQSSYSPDYFKFSPTCVLSKHLTAEKS